MKEISAIIKGFEQAAATGKKSALATVVHLQGSSYRRPGARMLIEEDGQLTGAISGGCLEGDALRKAQLVMHEGRSRLVTYDTMDEDDAKFGVGLGCNGIIQVLIEAIHPEDPQNPISFLKKLTGKKRHSVMATVFCPEDKFGPQPGTCLVLDEEEWHIRPDFIATEDLLADARQSLLQRQSAFKNYVSPAQSLTAFLEVVAPPVSLVVLGAGNDAIPVVQMAEILGWETIVMDGRANYATRQRFPMAAQVLVAKPEEVLQKISPNESTCFLLMTHNYNYDLAVLRQLLPQKVRYIGMLGPNKKRERMLKELSESGIELSPEALAVLHSPAGLDIGAETPEEIALSMVAEIKAVLAQTQPISLRQKEDPIHNRNALTIETVTVNAG